MEGELKEEKERRSVKKERHAFLFSGRQYTQAVWVVVGAIGRAVRSSQGWFQEGVRKKVTGSEGKHTKISYFIHSGHLVEFECERGVE